MAYALSAEKALAYLEARVLNDEWVGCHDDVAYYFKAPMAFIEGGRLREAGEALDVAAKYVEQGGNGSGNCAYATQFQHYPWMWICWAATCLGRKELAELCFSKMAAYVHPSYSGLVMKPFNRGEPFEADFFATGEVVKFALLCKKPQMAEAAADVLLHILHINQENMERGQFQLRWTGESLGNFAFVPGSGPFHCILQREPGQLYFLMAFPAMVLMELAARAEKAKAEAYHAGALKLLTYLKQCAGVFESPFSHKLGRAAAMASDKEDAVKVADFFLSQQQEAGNYQEDLEAMDSVDQTAEIAVWLYQIQQDLSPWPICNSARLRYDVVGVHLWIDGFTLQINASSNQHLVPAE